MYKNVSLIRAVIKAFSGISFLKGLHTSGGYGRQLSRVSRNILIKKVAGDVKLTYEELSTILTQVEACLNSRPIAPMVTADGEDVEALTPGHFLIGRPICALPDRDQTDKPTHILCRWHLCQQITQHYWKRWINEYLTVSRRVYKWKHPQRNVQVGDVVIMVEDDMKSTQWPIGRVEVVYPGKDGRVRVARIKVHTQDPLRS